MATPTEAQRALHHGPRWLKAFPAVSLGPAWFRAIAGPLPEPRFVATSGIDATNTADFLAAGARRRHRVVGGGVGCIPPQPARIG